MKAPTENCRVAYIISHQIITRKCDDFYFTKLTLICCSFEHFVLLYIYIVVDFWVYKNGVFHMGKTVVTEEQILRALSDIYVSVNVFDLKTQDGILFKTNKWIVEWINEYPNDLQKQSNNVVLKITEADDIEKMLAFVDLKTLDERMKGKHSISEIFQGKINGWCRARFTAVDYDEDGTIHHVIYSVESIDEEKKREHELMYLSQTDLMTNISNRGYGEASISEYLKNGIPGMFCILDVDYFKHFNDKYGHDIGDKVLIAIADILKKNKRSNDIVMRLGGDEFAAYFVGSANADNAGVIFNRLFNDLATINFPPLEEPITVSVGACFSNAGNDFDSVYKKADRCVYASKEIKGNSYTIDSDSQD